MRSDTGSIHRRDAARRLALPACLFSLLCGCQTARVAQPLTASLAGSSPDAQLEFWHTLATRPVTSNDEAFHGLLLDLDGKDEASGYGQRVAVLKSRKMLPANFRAPADQGVLRGTLAVALVRILHIRGGWALHVFGPQPRYAVRELEYLNLYPPSSPNQTFSGTEFLGVVGKLDDAQLSRYAGPRL